MDVFEHQGKTFVITGGASGMGAMYVGNFLDQGAKAVAILDLAVEQGTTLANQHNQKYPGKALFFKCDVSNEYEIEKTFNEVVAKLKQIDVIINNAGIMLDTPEAWRTPSIVNWQGVVSFTFKGIKHMSKKEGGKGGTIVNISSTGALVKTPFVPVYCGSKSAVMHFSQCLSMDPFYDTTGIRILCMCIGITNTPLLKNLESRAISADLGKALAQHISGDTKSIQRTESAVAAVDYAIKHGTNGSVWLSTFDKPAKDITSVVNETFALYQKVISDNAK